ncbi:MULTISPECIES: hypothetical protein [unclassified Streptomyces]|uniref:hypothetical protein n=1 Tax=unclassified Streptomyces TaxID=2593676 RepID=UPI0011A35B48|nr:hypothetical protein [Streptomyces sp. BK340]TVZ89480.1 hypothetical protein FB157_113172 [Streptomyces sp. BK340]
MILSKFGRRAGVAAASAALALGVSAGQASATDSNVSSWSTSSRCDGYFFCLYYSPNHAGGMVGYNVTQVSTISGNFNDGHIIRNDAASMENSVYCDVRTWVYPNYVGNSNYIDGGSGGNLNGQLRNNEASIAIDGHYGGHDPYDQCPDV